MWRHWETRDAVRRRFEAAVLRRGVPQDALVYDILEETLPRNGGLGLSGLDAVRPCFILLHLTEG